jgi:hypothetical protein
VSCGRTTTVFEGSVRREEPEWFRDVRIEVGSMEEIVLPALR